MKALPLIPRLWLLISLLFSIHINAQNNTIVGYEYAFNNGDGLQYVPITPVQDFNLVTDLDVSSLSSAINVLNIRFKDDEGVWSPIISSIFITPPVAENIDTNIVGYEYAFNNGEGLQYVPISPSQDFNLIADIDVSTLTSAINTIHVRFLDDDDKWSSMISHIFIRPPVASNVDTNIVGYEYAFNNGEGLQYVPITPSQDFNLITDLDVNSLESAINTIHLRFLDDDGKWSSLVSHIFIRPPVSSNVDTNIIGYEYAFNNGEGLQYVPITPSQDFNLITDIDVNSLDRDLNTIHVRFLDDDGKWSSMVSHIFIRPPLPVNQANNSIVSYVYWIDDDETTLEDTTINTPSETFLLSDLDLSQIWAGEHTINTQFKDVYGNYSVVMTDTINKAVLPLANFTVDVTEICAGSSVNFTNNSIDFDDQLWDFDDGDTSDLINVSHTFNTPGTYNVSLSIEDTSTGLTDIISQTIEVYEIPSNTITISSSLPACFGDTVTLTADYENGDYLWSNGATTRSIDVTADGNYSVDIRNTSNTLCSVTSSTINVTFNPEIDNTITTDATSLTANQIGASYQWIDCSNGNLPIDGEVNQSYSPIINGEYAVEITVNGCSVISDCIVISNLSVYEFDLKESITLYPNPVKNMLNIKTKSDVIIEVYDLSGKLVIKFEQKIGEGTLNMGNFNNGMYIFMVKPKHDLGNSQYIHKIIKN